MQLDTLNKRGGDVYYICMQLGLRHFGEASLAWFKEKSRDPSATRWSLARGICEREDWRNRQGEWCIASACKALPQLAAHLGVALPAARPVASVRAPASDYPDLALDCALEALGEVSVRRVAAKDVGAFRRLLHTHHPRGWDRSPGAALNCWIVSSRQGRLGGVRWSAASWHQACRDRWIGWSEAARVAHLQAVVRQSRFLILPGVRVPNLASHVLAKASKALATEWRRARGTAPLLEYTYVDPSRAGTCYRAAGWQRCAGRTSGRPPGGFRTSPKAVWVHPLSRHWRRELCAESGARLPMWSGSRHWPIQADWADREYGARTLGDARLRRRLVDMGRAWADRPGLSLPQVFATPAQQKGAYRLLSNARVTEEHVLDAHRQSTVDRCRLEPVVLAVQDTTMLNYSGLATSEGLAELGGGGKGVQGLPVHLTLAVTPTGRPLGVLEMDTRFRPPAPEQAETSERTRWLAGLDCAAELAQSCPDTRVIAVCDREADMFSMLERAAGLDVELLFRSSRGAKRTARTEAEDPPADLWERLASQPVSSILELDLPASGGARARAARTARLEVRSLRADLLPPRRCKERPPQTVHAVSATEIHPPADTSPLHWVLLSTRPFQDAQEAVQALERYRRRWVIEEYFKVLKSGARIEERRLDHADDLRKCLAFDAITAWRVFDLDRLARVEPDRPAIRVLTREEIETLDLLLEDLGSHARKHQTPDPERQTIRQTVINIGRLAGFQPSKRQPLPGNIKLWQGYVLLKPAVRIYLLMKQKE